MPGGETPTALNYQGNITLPTQAEGAGDTTSAPAGGATIASASLVPGAYTVSWQVGLGGTPAVGDQDNFGLYSGATLLATSSNPGAAGEYPQGPFQLTVPTNTTVTVKAIGAGTATQYSASLSAVPLPVVSPDDPLYPYNPLTIDGTSVNVTSTPANLAVTMAGFDLSAQAECQLGKGSNVPSGTTDFGFVDTTYLPTQAQQLQGMQACQF